MERLGTTIRAAERKGPARFVTGVTTSAATNQRISVEVAGAVITADIPGSFRATLVAGQDVRLSVQGSTHTVDSVLSALSTPTVAAAPAADDNAATGPENFGEAGFSNLGFESPQDWELSDYADYVAGHVRILAGEVGELRTMVNSLRSTVVALRAALVTQGHIT
jgi:hypothetical protein